MHYLKCRYCRGESDNEYLIKFNNPSKGSPASCFVSKIDINSVGGDGQPAKESADGYMDGLVRIILHSSGKHACSVKINDIRNHKVSCFIVPKEDVVKG